MNKIKFSALFCCILLIFTTVLGQKRGILQVIHEEKTMGKNLETDMEITGSEFTFPEIVSDVFFDPETNFATVQITGRKNTKTILQYDIKNQIILWNKKIDSKVNELLKFDSLLILNDYNDSYVINQHTGEYLSKILSYISFANPKHKIGIAYMYNTMDGCYTNELLGIDLMTGRLNWKKKISKDYGWDERFYLNDSTLIVAASGLHLINILTGEGWSYHTQTGIGGTVANPNTVVAGVVAGAAVGTIIGALTGVFIVPIPVGYATTSNIIKGISSNALVDNGFIYHASREQIVKLDNETGKIVWRYMLPKDMASKSSIFIDEKMVFLVNFGYAVQYNQQKKFGKPFIAAFDKKTGENKYFSTIRTNNPILGYQEIDNELFLLFVF
jgi:outer membrane protein assembly factor BamB